MATIIFIRPDNRVPTARHGYGDNCPAFEFRNNVMAVDEAETALIAALQSAGAEEVSADDPRYDWILREGWSRQSQRDYARQPVEKEPASGQ